jgi:hypothetical protein
MNRTAFSATLTLVAVTPFGARGQDLPENLNRFSIGPTFAINIKADFYNNLSAGPAAGGANHNYDDGYVLVDSSGNAGGLTRNWGYQNASQFNAVGDTMQFHAVQPGNSSSVTGNPQYGAELIYQRVIGSLHFLQGDWGFEGGLGFTDIDLRQNLGGTAPVTVDSFPLNGVVPPPPGYNGTFAGPGPLLGDTPTRTFASATLSGYEKLSGGMFPIRLGPFAEWNLTRNLSLAASVGLTLAPTVVNYDFSETATLAGGETFVESGHSSDTELLYGPYVGAMVRYDFNKSWGIYAGGRYQNLTDLDQTIGTRTARLDPGTTIYFTVGASWRF